MRIEEANLKAFASAVLRKSGLKKKRADEAAEVLVFADARGIESHGVSKLSIYVKRIKAGGIDPKAEPEVVSRVGGLCRIDAHNALGPVGGYFGAKTAAAAAKEHGIGLAFVGNSNHFGVTAFYSMMGIGKNLVGFAFSNANPTMAPWGGKKALVGTSPLSVAIPTRSGLPVVIDMASSLVARGKIILYAQKKQRLPAGWALDENGKETLDPEAALKGLLTPMGGAKGSGLALVIDVLCGVLTGSKWLTGVGHLYSGVESPQGIGHVFGAIDIAALMKPRQFLAVMDEYVKTVHDCPKADGVGRIYMPGEIEYLKTLESRKEGVHLSEATAADLKKVGEDTGVDFAAYL